MLVSSLVRENLFAFLALESRVVKHVLDHVYNSDLFEFVPTMRA